MGAATCAKVLVVTRELSCPTLPQNIVHRVVLEGQKRLGAWKSMAEGSEEES